MDKDRVKGKMDDAEGRIKRQVGEWTGDTKAQVEGAAQQVKGKAEDAWGKMKDAVRDADPKDESGESDSKDQARRPYPDDEKARHEQEKRRDVA